MVSKIGPEDPTPECCSNAEADAIPPFDITIVCGNQTFDAHKHVLERGSNYFQEYFPSVLAHEEIRNGIVQLKETDGATFKAVLHYLYNSCTSKIKSNLLSKVLEASRFLGIDDLYHHCWTEMKKNLDVDYFCDLLMLGEAYEEEESLVEIIRFIASKFVHTSRTTDFFKLESRHVEALLHHPYWNGSSDGALVAVMQWLKYNFNKRQNEMENVVSAIDLDTLSSMYLGLLLADDAIFNSMFHLGLNDTIMDTIMNLCSQRFIQSDVPEPTPGHSIVCFTHIENNRAQFGRTMFRLEEAWGPTEITPFTFLKGAATAVYRGDIYIIGGSTYRRKLVRTVYQYNPITNMVYSISQLQTPVYDAAVGVLKDRLYIVGGVINTIEFQDSLTVQKYDPGTRTTTILAPLVVSCAEPSVVSIGDYLYAVGKDPLTLQRYDVDSNQWSAIECPSPPVKVCNCASWKGKIFLVNWNSIDFIEVELYDPAVQTWERKTIAQEPLDVYHVWSLNEGTNRTPMLVFHRGSSIKLYDPALETWSSLNMSAGSLGQWHPEYSILV